VTLKRGQNTKYLPPAFTEYGALMAANIPNRARAVQMSIFVVRAFAKLQETQRAAPAVALEAGMISFLHSSFLLLPFPHPLLSAL